MKEQALQDEFAQNFKELQLKMQRHSEMMVRMNQITQNQPQSTSRLPDEDPFLMTQELQNLNSQYHNVMSLSRQERDQLSHNNSAKILD